MAKGWASAVETSRRLRRSFLRIQTICTTETREKARFGPHGECRRGPKRSRFGSAGDVNRRFALAHRQADRKAAKKGERVAEQIVDIRKNPHQNAHGGGLRAAACGPPLSSKPMLAASPQNQHRVAAEPCI